MLRHCFRAEAYYEKKLGIGGSTQELKILTTLILRQSSEISISSVLKFVLQFPTNLSLSYTLQNFLFLNISSNYI
jgi:hypothetical protein